MTDTVDETTANAKIYGYTILVGVGIGCYVVAGFGIIQTLVPASDIANAVSAMTICKETILFSLQARIFRVPVN